MSRAFVDEDPGSDEADGMSEIPPSKGESRLRVPSIRRAGQ